MNILYAIGLFIVAIFVVLAAMTRLGVFSIERAFPPSGTFVMARGAKIHLHHVKAGDDKPTVVFIHGASGNLHDQMSVFKPALEGKFNLIFFDRPGHGYSTVSRDGDLTPQDQAATMAAMLDALGVQKAVVVGHSFGGAVASSFALFHPEKTQGQILLSPVSHPWPGGINWYYTLMGIPLIDHLFSQTLALPAGLSRLDKGTACVFAPNKPTENYRERTGVALVLRPYHFLHNGRQVAALYEYVSNVHPRYKEIKAPTIILTGNKDTIVLADIHSVGLARDIAGAELYWVENLGHKPDHIGLDFVVAAIGNLAENQNNDLVAKAKELEAKIAPDAFGPVENCLNAGDLKSPIRSAIARTEEERLKGVQPAYR